MSDRIDNILKDFARQSFITPYSRRKSICLKTTYLRHSCAFKKGMLKTHVE